MKNKKLFLFYLLFVILLALTTTLFASCAFDDNTGSVNKYEDETNELYLISVNYDDAKIIFYVGDEFDFSGLKVFAYYSNGSTVIVNDYTITYPDMSENGYQEVKITYAECTTSYYIKILSVSIDRVEVGGEFKTEYYEGDTFDSTGMTLTAYYNNGSQQSITDFTISEEKLTSDTESITVTYNLEGKEYETSVSIKVLKLTVTSLILDLKNVRTEYFQGDTFTYDGLSVSALYNNGDITPTESFSVTQPDMNKVGKADVIITFGDVSATYTVTIKQIMLESIKVTGDYKKEYVKGETFDGNGMIVTAYYNNGSSKSVNPTEILVDTSSVGQNIIGYVTFTENGITKSAVIYFNVHENDVYKIELDLQNVKTYFCVGDSFTCEGIIVKLIMRDGSYAVAENFTVTVPNMSASGIKEVMISCQGMTATYKIVVDGVGCATVGNCCGFMYFVSNV